MGVTARSAKSLTHAANARQPSRGTPVRAGTYTTEVGSEVISGWHSHDRHQLEYAFEGVVEVETENARYLLPPQQAVWIPAGVEHSSTLTNVKAISAFFDPSMGVNAGHRVRILAAAPVIREMMLYARRWPSSRAVSDPAADRFFAVLADLVVEWLDHEAPMCLPTSTDPLVAAAMEYTQAHLADIAFGEVCKEVGASERTLRRAFIALTGMSWRTYLQESRVLRAMTLLAEGEHNMLTIAITVGFDSASAFSRAFGRYTGESPQAYRRRICSLPAPTPLDLPPEREPHEEVRAWTHWSGVSSAS